MRLTCKTAIGYCDMSIATRENKLQKLGQYEDIDENPEHLAKASKALETMKGNLRMVGNCLQAKAPFCEDGWVFVKEIEDGEEYDALKEVLS